MKNVTLLDALIIVLGACALSLFLFWGAGEFAGIRIFVDAPSYLRAIANNLFTVATTGALGATLLALLRKQISTDSAPHYLLFIPAGTAIIIGAVIGISKIIPPDREVDRKTALSVTELTRKSGTEDSEFYGLNYAIRSYSSTLKIKARYKSN